MQSSNTKHDEEKKPISLISTIKKEQHIQSSSLFNNYYYSVVIIQLNAINLEIINKEEFVFSKKDMYGNKIDSRLFYDTKIDEYEDFLIGQQLDNTNYKTKLELFLIEENVNNKAKHFLLISSTDGENFQNKQFETTVLNSLANRCLADSQNKMESINTKNSFLDSNYKD